MRWALVAEEAEGSQGEAVLRPYGHYGGYGHTMEMAMHPAASGRSHDP